MPETNPGWRLARTLLSPVLRAALNVRIEGGRHLPRAGGALLAPNHVSVLDAFVIAIAADDRGRHIRILAGAEFFESKLGPGLRAIRAIPIRRGARDLDALDVVKDVLRDGDLVCLFPEGRVGDGVTTRRGRSGLARLALDTGVPVVPIGIWGTNARWPQPGLRFAPPLRPRVGLVFGEPMKLEGDSGSPRAVRAATTTVMSAIETLVERAKARSVR